MTEVAWLVHFLMVHGVSLDNRSGPLAVMKNENSAWTWQKKCCLAFWSAQEKRPSAFKRDASTSAQKVSLAFLSLQQYYHFWMKMRFRKICFPRTKNKEQQKLAGLSVCVSPHWDREPGRDFTKILWRFREYEPWAEFEVHEIFQHNTCVDR